MTHALDGTQMQGLPNKGMGALHSGKGLAAAGVIKPWSGSVIGDMSTGTERSSGKPSASLLTSSTVSTSGVDGLVSRQGAMDDNDNQ